MTRYLERDGYAVTTAADGTAALEIAEARAYDLVVFDLMLPGVAGLDVLGELRRHSDTPVIVLTARSDEGDRVLGLELGADDYVVKPFSPRELAARVRSVLRRASTPPASGSLRFEGLRIDLVTRDVEWAAATSISLAASSTCSPSWPPPPGRSSHGRGCSRRCGTPRRTGRIPRP